jgi:uncharacterized membrane protein YhaH (DUF805 family)
MNFFDATKHCLRNYATFTGRASRSEFWWFSLFCTLASLAGSIVNDRLGGLITLGLLVPALAVSARRLHDLGKSGWWQLVSLVPLVGWLIVLYWFVQPSRPVDTVPAATR